MAKNGKYSIGIDLGGTSIKIGIVNSKGKIVSKLSLPTKAEEGPNIVVSQIKKGIKEIISSHNKLKIDGIGIGSPGVISAKKGTVENPPNFPGWEKVNLKHQLKKSFNYNIFIENDANAAAIGEMIFGSGKKINSFIMITLGTGVGGGIIYNKKIFRGDFGAAGELGHTTIDYNGTKCKCGSYGCIETYVGNNYMVNRVKAELKGNPNSKIMELIDYRFANLTPKIISDAAQTGDRFAVKVISDTGFYLGCALASVANLLDISTFVIGGGVAGFGKLLFNSIEETIKQRVLKPLSPRVKILPAKLQNEAGIKGASALVFYKA